MKCYYFFYLHAQFLSLNSEDKRFIEGEGAEKGSGHLARIRSEEAEAAA